METRSDIVFFQLSNENEFSQLSGFFIVSKNSPMLVLCLKTINKRFVNQVEDIISSLENTDLPDLQINH